MIEKFELKGFRKVWITENDPIAYVWTQIAIREFDSYPTDEQKEQFCKDYDVERIEVIKFELNLFQ